MNIIYLNTRLLALVFFWELTVNQTLSSQELEYQKRNLSPRMTEEFNVLKSNKKIKEGQYKLVIDDFICQMGFYKNNQKSGIWSVFCCIQAVSPWAEIVYNYDTNELIYFEKDIYFSREDSTLCLPIYLGGTQYFKEAIMNLLDRNETRLGNGRLYISFGVDSTGLPNNFRLKSSCNNKKLDLMAVDAVKKVATSNFKFIPARRNGKSISYNVEVPIYYTNMDIQVIPYD
jgi:hypothetical protein